MNNNIYITIFLFCITFSLYATELSLRKEGIKSRVFNVTSTNESLVINVNSSVTLRDPFPDNDTNIEWYLNRGDDIITIYESQRLEPALAEVIRCSPTEAECESLIITKLSTDLIGEYARVSRTKGKVGIHFYHYLITGYQMPLKITCDSNKLHACNYNETSKELYVREDQDVQLECSAILWKYSTYDSPTEIHISECADNPDERRKLGRQYGLYMYELSTKCSKRFSKTDENFACILQYSQLQRNDVSAEIDRLEVALDIEFGPITDEHTLADLNKNAVKGKDVVLRCPFSGNPIKYFWKDVGNSKNGEFSGGKELVVSKTLSAGRYAYECRAEIASTGSDPVKTESIKFQVTITEPKKGGKNQRLYVLIGAIVGGVLALALVIIVVVILMRGRKKRSEKPKTANRSKGQPKGADDEDVTFRK